MDGLTSIVSFGVSICSAMFTFYFWIMKARMERPHLASYPVGQHVSGHAFSSSGDPIKLIFEPKFIVANYSSLPNALLGARLWVKARCGDWLPAKTTLSTDTPVPLNINPMQTVRLNLTSTIEVPAVVEGNACRNTNETFALYRKLHLPDALELKLELTALGEKRFALTMKYPPKQAAEGEVPLRLVG